MPFGEHRAVTTLLRRLPFRKALLKSFYLISVAFSFNLFDPEKMTTVTKEYQ